MNIETQKNQIINNLSSYSAEDLADMTFIIWVEQQERLQADRESLIQFTTDLHISKSFLNK